MEKRGALAMPREGSARSDSSQEGTDWSEELFDFFKNFEF